MTPQNNLLQRGSATSRSTVPTGRISLENYHRITANFGRMKMRRFLTSGLPKTVSQYLYRIGFVIDTENLDWSKCTFNPFEHQVIGVKALMENKYFGLLDEMGAGKTKQVIDAACFLYEREQIDLVLIICPAQVKDVWIHPQYSQIIEHAFAKGIIHEFTSRTEKLPGKEKGLTWVVTSVELLRQPKHVQTLINLLKGRKLWAIIDESSTISNWKAAQTKGVMKIKPWAARRSILNGTPVGQSPMNLYSQFDFLDSNILGFKNFFAFRNRHARMGGWQNKQVVGFNGLEEIQNKIKPYVLRRLKEHCLDIKPKMDAPIREVRLSKETWAMYVQMRDEFVAYLDGQEDRASVVTAAPIKSLRLAQLCSGFLGGVQEDGSSEPTTHEVSRELTDDFLDYLHARLQFDENYRLIVWCRFRPEIARLERLAKERFPQLTVRVLQGGLSKADRSEAVSLFHPDAPDPIGPALLIGQPQAGRFGLNFTKCSNVDYISNDHSFLTRSQSEDRIHRPGQKFQAYFQNYVVVGPNRERTVSGMILKALKNHEEVASWTCSQWVSELMQEDPDDF
jgi:SNF2 family DNA or RNA helicase